MAEYSIEQGLSVRGRMDLLARVYAPTTNQLLDRVTIPAGATWLDVGCGGGHVAREMARRAGPAGSVLGIDLDEALLDVARREAAMDGFTNTQFRVAKAEEISGTGFDVAYARLLLMHVSDPEQVILAMTSVLRPGGTIVLEDAHFSGRFCSPPNAAYERAVTWTMETVLRRGGDPDIGPRLPRLLADVGMEHIGVSVAQPVFIEGVEKHLMEISTEKMRPAITATGVATDGEFDALHADLVAYTNRPDTLIAMPRLIQCWGTKPA